MASKWLSLEDFVLVPATTENRTAELLSRLLTHAQFNILQLFGSGMVISMSAFGVCSNIINIHTFLKMKPLDGVTVSFLCLSVSDMLSSLFSIVYGACVLLFAIELMELTSFTVSVFVFKSFFGNTVQIFYTITILNTIFIAVSRYACVARPLKFKGIFTVKLSVLLFMAFSVFSTIIYLPILSAMVFSSGSGNSTRSGSRFIKSPALDMMRDCVQLLMHCIIPITSQVVIGFCVFGMAAGLRKSQAFRLRFQKEKADSELVQMSNNTGLTGKELQVVRQVVIVSLIYLVCNILKITTFLAATIEPDYGSSPSHRFGRLSNVMHVIRRFFESINCSVNIFIYLKFNRRFWQNCIIPTTLSSKPQNKTSH